MDQLDFSSKLFNTTPAAWTVSELSAYISELFDIDYRLQDLHVRGEISNFTRARSGHLYFTLKDEQSQIRCVMWRSAADKLVFRPQEGDAIIARGRVSVYETGGTYQLYVEKIEPVGRGGLAVAFEELKAKLLKEGLFDEDHKKPLPFPPKLIGIVTSADAAALRDILNVLNRRWPLASVLISPSLVQGSEAPAQIIRAIGFLDGRDDIDVIIVARGGGSIEDLWAFNDEGVARAIFQAEHPIVVGVGHETDFTIADFVADVRAPTPSAAAEIVVPNMPDYALMIRSVSSELLVIMQNSLRLESSKLAAIIRSLHHLSPAASYDRWRQQLDWLTGRLDRAEVTNIEQLKAKLGGLGGRLAAVAPDATLARGYAIVRREDEKIVHRTADVESGDQISIRVQDGEFGAKVE
ncbi:MAG: exodeoxyribonuclease VII large subunit [Anaerolineae bacterium]|nr:MAG: exodeoxyribonuclease VII large subunit [Anaerolineae bacterium]